MKNYTLNKFGLRDKDMNYLQNLFSTFPSIEKVLLFGSRAKGNYEVGSDIDLAIVGKNVTFDEISNIRFQLENESPLLLKWDVIHYETIKNQELKNKIDESGKIIFEKSLNSANQIR